jgi:hypothetical protein
MILRGNFFRVLLFYLPTTRNSTWFFSLLIPFDQNGQECDVEHTWLRWFATLSNLPCTKRRVARLWEGSMATANRYWNPEIMEDARKLGPVKGEELLKQNGLRLIDVCSDPYLISTLFNSAQNAFMTVRLSDPYLALSWDGMHAHDHGLGGKHLWPALQNCIKQYG